MSIAQLKTYLPEGTLLHLKNWFGDYYIHIKITKDRHSKLGDYRKMPDNSHQITINSTLEAFLFFFVLTHELAHMIAFESYSKHIQPHGNEWKYVFRNMILQSIDVYPEDLRPILLKFSKSPKANFMASPELVKYFHAEDLKDEESYIDDLKIGSRFRYRNMSFLILEKRKINYLCRNLENDRKYIFKPLAKVEKLT